MNAHASISRDDSATPAVSDIDTQLRGRQLLYARVAYLTIAAIVVALNVVALPNVYASQLTPDQLRALYRAGFSPTLYTLISTGVGVVSFLLYLSLSLLIFWRRSEERMAWFCAVMLVTFGGVAASPLDDTTGGGPMPQPLASIAVLTVTVHLLAVVGQVSVVAFFYLFPSGRFVPRWTRLLALLALAYWLANVFFPALVVGPQGSSILVFWLAGVVAQVYRYRRVSTPVEREQTKWIVFGFVLAFLIVAIPSILLLLPNVANSAHNSGSVVVGLIFSNTWIVAILIIPVVIAIAVLRTHLWDIDVIINRTLVYGSLTALLAAIYFAGVVGTQSLVNLIAGQPKQPSPVVIVVTTLVIAALFTPLRRRIQTTIDRRFYRRKYDAAKTLERFSATLRTETDLEGLRAHVVGVVDETMQPVHVSLWLRPRGRSDV